MLPQAAGFVINSLATVVSHEYLLELLGYKYMHSFVIIVLLQYHVL